MENEKVAAEKKRKNGKEKSGKDRIVLYSGSPIALLGGFFPSIRKKTPSQKRQGDQSRVNGDSEADGHQFRAYGVQPLSPKDTYEVTSLVEGEVIEANFEEGDVVWKKVRSLLPDRRILHRL